MKRLSKVKIEWSPKMAYVVGLLAADGCLSVDGRHIDFTSKDLEMVEIFKNYLNLTNRITKKTRSIEQRKRYFHIQFGDRNFYEFLLGLGLTPRKSKTIGPLKIPRKYYADFLRGCIDGDGNIQTFKHPESKKLQLKVRLFSASKKFLIWIKKENEMFGINGYFKKETDVHTLEYAKSDSIKLLNGIYYTNFPQSLGRKFLLAEPYLRTWRNWQPHTP